MPTKILSRTSPKIVLANGCFDPLHYGHVLHLREAKRLGDILVVSVTRDEKVNKGPLRPFLDDQARADMLRELRCVDVVIVVGGLLEALYAVLPAVLVKGPDYGDGMIEQAHREFCEQHGVEIAFTKAPKWSSTKLLADGAFA